MIVRLLAAALLLTQAATAQEIRPLVAGGALTESLAGGDQRVFAIDVPANAAARVVVRQDGIDVGYTLRRSGSRLPEHGLDMVAGPGGEEVVVVPVSDTAATWNIYVSTALPLAARGNITLAFEMQPADDRLKAIAAARARYQLASDTAWGGDARSFVPAQALYEESAAAAHDLGDTVLEAEAIYQGARIRDNLGDTPGAIEGQRRALALFRALGRRDREARVLNRLGDLSRKVGEIDDAERYFREALPAAREAADPVTTADILNNSGLLLLTLGRYEEAIGQLQSAIPLAQEVNSANVETALVNNIAEGYTQLGMYDKALETYQRGLVVVARLNLPRRTARTWHMLAAAQFESGDRAGAETSIRKSLELYAQSGDNTLTAQALGFYGLMRHANGDTTAAVELFARALPLLKQSPLALSGVLSAWADVDLDRGDTEAALAKADEALGLSRSIRNPAAEQKALYVRSRALQKNGRLDDAVGAIAAAVESVETTRALIRRSEMRTSYLTTVRNYFDLYIDLLRQKGDAAAAFEMSEHARARTLLEGLASAASKISKGIDPQLLAGLRAAQAALNAKENYRAQVVVAGGQNSPRAIAVEKDVERLLDRWHDARARVRDASPAYWALQSPEPVSVERVQTSLLDADSVLVEYHLGAARSYVWVIDRQSITMHDLPPMATIDAVARRYHQQLSRETDGLATSERSQLSTDIASLGRRLAAMVWQPIEARVRGKRLLIAADGVLQYVPFAALPGSTGELLIVKHEIVYVPSASVLETIRKESRPIQAKSAVAVFADPVFSKDDPRVAGARTATAMPSKSRGATGGYSRLRFSRLEADAISAAATGAFEALDFNAAKKTLTARDLRKYRILHFATHGSLDTEHPELSGLVLSLVDSNAKPVDGFLRLHEIYNLDLDADLVVLSACSTALGKEVHGEGLIGLTRGFIYAGASRVVSSVWNVDDRASARLMTGFYTAMLSQGLSPASALRAAQLTLLRDPRWTNPHYWAAFGLQGEWK
ncbi:MAG: CHAT domain-containing protein [Vicinamibacterales bacterium]